VDGAGNVFVGMSNSPFLKYPAAGGNPSMITVSPQSIISPAVIDGVGNLFALGSRSTLTVVELPAGSSGPFIETNFAPQAGTFVAVDALGDLFALENGLGYSPTDVLELPAGADSSVVLPLNGSNLNAPTGLAADAVGDVFVSDGSAYDYVLELPAGSATPIQLPFSSLDAPSTVTLDSVGNVYISNFVDSSVPNPWIELTPDGTQYVVPTPDYVGYASSLTVSASGDLYLTGRLPLQCCKGSAAKIERSKLDSLDFGDVPVGSTKTLPLAMINTGNRTLVIKPCFESPSYKIVRESPNSCLAGTAPGHTCTLQVEFSALSAGDHTIALTLGGNSAIDSVIQLKGTGTESK
jgi:hypothetical protein